jgi:hypothetical protein
LSAIGRATALDEHVNRPGHVSRDVGSVLDSFFTAPSAVSRNVNSWVDSHSNYDNIIIDLYGNNRDMTDPVGRFQKIKVALSV